MAPDTHKFDYKTVAHMLQAPLIPPPLPKKISEPSVKSLFIEMLFGEVPVATGSGFVCLAPGGPVLVTNWHNVTGRNHHTGACLDTKHAAVPDRLRISHDLKGSLGKWTSVIEPLYDPNGIPLWKEHPRLGSKVDFVALPLSHLANVELVPYDLQNQVDLEILIADQISVVGFPFGLTARGTAVWATGFVASEPQLDFDALPLFLVDCRTRKGQSGSAVIAHRTSAAYTNSKGNTVMGAATKLLGIYSGRINDESDLGKVWKAVAIKELVQSVV